MCPSPCNPILQSGGGACYGLTVRAGREKGWHAPQLKRGGEQLDGRVERPFGEQLTRLGGLLVGEHESVTISHAPRGETGGGRRFPRKRARRGRKRGRPMLTH